MKRRKISYLFNEKPPSMSEDITLEKTFILQ